MSGRGRRREGVVVERGTCNVGAIYEMVTTQLPYTYPRHELLRNLLIGIFPGTYHDVGTSLDLLPHKSGASPISTTPYQSFNGIAAPFFFCGPRSSTKGRMSIFWKNHVCSSSSIHGHPEHKKILQMLYIFLVYLFHPSSSAVEFICYCWRRQQCSYQNYCCADDTSCPGLQQV